MSNNINHHDINEETQFQVNKERHEAMKRKFRPKTEVQRLKGVFFILTGVWLTCQTISALLASTGFIHYATQKFNNNGLLIITFVVLLCGGLELAFNTVTSLINRQKYDDKTPVSSILYGMFIGLGIFYATSSFFGTPHAVEYFAAKPDYHKTELIVAKYEQAIAKDTTYWNGQLTMASSSANAYKFSHGKRDCKDVDKCPWRLRTSALAGHSILLAKVDSVSAAATSSLLAIKSDMKQELAMARIENKAMKSAFIVWCGTFGFSLSLISLVCIPIFFFSYSWCAKYKRLEIADNDSILSKLEEAKKKEEAQERAEIEKIKAQSEKVIEKGEDKETPKVTVNEPSIPMGFVTASIKEGDIVKGEGRKSDRVYVEVKGELRAMTYGEVNTLKKGQSTPKRINHLERLMNKLK